MQSGGRRSQAWQSLRPIVRRSSVNCNKVSHLLSAFMDGELLGYEHRQIHHHLQQCVDCRTEYDELLQMKRLLAAMRLREPDKKLAASIVQRVAAEPEPASVG